MQNKLSFHQSSASLEIIGLPDYSNNEKKDQISIISQWKLTIVDKPLIEGKIEHLGPIMDAFYIYTNLLIKNEIPIYESKLIKKIFCLPGNAGTSQIATNLDVDTLNFPKVLKLIKFHRIDLVIVGPEEPLVKGIVDFLSLIHI